MTCALPRHGLARTFFSLVFSVLVGCVARRSIAFACGFIQLPSLLPRVHRGATMAGLLKKTTGLVGLAVSQNPHERLRILYTKILATMQTIPKDAAYRKYTEQIVNERFNIVQTVRNTSFCVLKRKQCSKPNLLSDPTC
ncbi:hypothetical protein FKM82_029755 [Ascaphus truei]